MSNFPVVKIHGVKPEENTHIHGDKVWNVSGLIMRAKELVPFDLPLAAIYIGAEVWEPTGSVSGMAWHMRRALEVDTSHPVIMDADGFIMDGWHRVLRAIIDGKSTIKAVRFGETPPCDYVKERP